MNDREREENKRIVEKKERRKTSKKERQKTQIEQSRCDKRIRRRGTPCGGGGANKHTHTHAKCDSSAPIATSRVFPRFSDQTRV